MTQHVSQRDSGQKQEIGLIEIIQKLWRNRKFILKITLGVMIIGLLVALFSAKEYTASCTMVPQSSDKKIGGNLGGLAAIAGINLGDMGGGEVLSPKMYPKILMSIPFQKELMLTEIKFEEHEQPIRLIDYFTNKKYQKFNLGGTIVKYTIGLPGLIINTIRGEQENASIILQAGSSMQSLTKEEKQCVDILKDKINLTVNDKDGYVQLSANMSEALAAAQLAEKVQLLLQKYITEFKIEKVQSNLDFVKERYEEVQHAFEQIQEERAVFKDANKNIYSAKALTESEKWDTRYNLALNVYMELAKQLEQAKIQVKETTPILTIVDPVTIPNERSKPRRGLILVLFTFLGGFVGVGTVLFLPFIALVSGAKKLEAWLPEGEQKNNKIQTDSL